ncbi:MAG: outer membrane protein [Candidatus Berkiella sp.]
MNIKKIIGMTCSALLFPYAAHADLKSNWLLGLSGGYVYQDGELHSNLDYTNILPPGIFKTYFDNNLNSNSAIGGIFGGYQMNCQDWIFGLELSVDAHDLDFVQSFAIADRFGVRGWAGVTEYEKGTSVALSTRLAYHVTPYVIPFIRLGVDTSKDELRVSYRGAPEYPGQYTTTDGKRVYRLLAGFGLESVVPYLCFLTARLEYNFLSSGKNLHSQGLIIDNLTNPFFINDAAPKFHTWKFSAVWNFG